MTYSPHPDDLDEPPAPKAWLDIADGVLPGNRELRAERELGTYPDSGYDVMTWDETHIWSRAKAAAVLATYDQLAGARASFAAVSDWVSAGAWSTAIDIEDE